MYISTIFAYRTKSGERLLSKEHNSRKRQILKLALVFALISPYPAIAASFDCSKAKSVAEMTICNDPELSRLDDELAAIYKRAESQAKDRTTFQTQSKSSWTWRETNCLSKECLLSWYIQRKATLLKIISSSTPNKCLRGGPVKQTGFVISQALTLQPKGEAATVYLLALKVPICVRVVSPEPTAPDEDLLVDQFQLVGYGRDSVKQTQLKQYLFQQVDVQGVLTTDNVTQYYAVRTAIDVKSIRAAEAR